MPKDNIYPDIPPEKMVTYYRNLDAPAPKFTEIFKSGGAPIDSKTGNIVVPAMSAPNFHRAIESSSNYPAVFRDEAFFEPDIDHGREIKDSVVSMPRKGQVINSASAIYNPLDDVYNPNDNSVYRRYMFDRQAFNDDLPVAKYRDAIVRRIETYSVVVIEGETGCGKTTQIPPLLLHNAAQKGEYANIVVTQPRRIAAISVARQVCLANRWQFKPPGICGYQIGSEKRNVSPDTRLLFCTTGVVLRKLMQALKLRNEGRHLSTSGHFTHIIIDEVHERDRDMDLLMLLVKKYRAEFPTVKVILMSATFQTSKIAQYFKIPGANGVSISAPILKVEGRKFDVEEFYLDDLCRSFPDISKPRLELSDPHLNSTCIEICVRTLENFTRMERGGPMGACLVFLPGMQEIRTVQAAVDRVQNLEIITLHSDINVEEQRRAFLPVPAGKRKVILSTNIAESSITVPDIVYVIDFCLNKVLFTDHTSSHLECLRLCWASKANCQQRAGRAGRVQNGRCYRLIERKMYQHEFMEFPQPEILRASLCQTVLQVKLLDMGGPREILANAIDPPEEKRIHNAVLLCKEVQALSSLPWDETNLDRMDEDERQQFADKLAFDGDLTYLGEILANLPVDVRLGKLIIFGHMFGVAEACVIIAASLTVKSFFLKLFREEFAYYVTRQLFSRYEKSDPLTYLIAYETMESLKFVTDATLRNNGIHPGRFAEVRFLVEELKTRLVRFGIDFRSWTENLPPEKRALREDHRYTLIRLAIAAANYPNYFLSSKRIDMDMLQRELAGRPHLNTVQLSNLPQNFGFFYHDKLVKIFRKCLFKSNQRFRIFYEQSKAYIEFYDPDKPSDAISDCVYLAIRMRMLRQECLPPIQPYDSHGLQKERDRLVTEARHFYRQKNKLTPTLIMITDDATNVSLSNNAPPVDDKPTSTLLHPSSSSKYALPGDSVQCVKLQITHVVTCCRFFAQFIPINEVDAEYNKIHQLLNDPEYPLLDAQIANLEIGCMYAALHYNPYFAWQRAILLNINANTLQVLLRFVDLGEEIDVNVEYMRVCPPQITQVRYQAVSCRLAHVRENTQYNLDAGRNSLAKNQFENGNFGLVRLKQFDAEIFSVVHDEVALDLFAKREDEKVFSVANFFCSRGFAVNCGETPESLQDHNQRSRDWGIHPETFKNVEEENESYWPLRFSSINFPNLSRFEDPFHLRIQSQPAELNWSCPVYGYGERTLIKLSSDSINCISLAQYPTLTFPYLLTAASAAKDDRRGSIILDDTTMFMPKPALPAIIGMLFSPCVELIKGSRQNEFPIGVFCGLGSNPNTLEPCFSEHDFFLNLDAKISENDINLINFIRNKINAMIDRRNPVLSQNATQFRQTQQELIEAILKLVEFTERSIIPDPEFPKSRFIHWALPHSSNRQAHQAVLQDITCQMHDGKAHTKNITLAFYSNVGSVMQSNMKHLSIDDDAVDGMSDMQELERNLKELRQLLLDNVEFTTAHCRICDQQINSLRHLRVHMAAMGHTSRVKLLESRLNAGSSGSRARQAQIEFERDRIPSTAILMESFATQRSKPLVSSSTHTHPITDWH